MIPTYQEMAARTKCRVLFVVTVEILGALVHNENRSAGFETLTLLKKSSL